ncbi:MAG: cytochrome-c peroxidase, partial [Chitinophagaceae bacterium]
FKQAFGQEKINSQQILFALAQFERTLVSAGSRYDKYIRNEPGGNLTELELKGLQLVKENCAGCHSTDLFTDGDYHNNGLDDTFSEENEKLAWGRGRITQKETDKGKYRTPSLRNVALTAPYMHDGRFGNLEQVLDHYTSGVKMSASLDPLLQKQNQPGISLTTDQKLAITAFLHALTDQEFTQNPAFAKPAN